MNVQASTLIPQGGKLVNYLSNNGVHVPQWMYAERFPIIPNIYYDGGDKYNASKISFRWGPIWLWTLEYPYLEIGVCCDTHWGIGLRFLLPYLRMVISLPLPYSFRHIENQFRRTPKT